MKKGKKRHYKKNISPSTSNIKRKRGRPRKSKDEIPNLVTEPIIKKKRGRPPKQNVDLEAQYKEYKKSFRKTSIVSKISGYCPKCEAIISKLDVVKNKYTCYKCGNMGKVKELKATKHQTVVFKNKKEYLSDLYVASDVYESAVKEENTEEKEE